MNDKKFWKIIYLYITKYNYNILHYRPEKKDVWLIDENNELVRFIYSDSFKSSEIDGIVSNIIRNEERLKKMFKLSCLKIKILYVSPDFDSAVVDYKKYRISSSLMIERMLYNDKNRKLFIKEADVKFIDNTPDTLRYKNRVVELYKRQTLDRNILDIKYSGIAIFYLITFILNYLLIYFSNRGISLYQYLNYNYQKIISGQFYRFFTSVFVIENVKSLIVILLTLLATSVLFNKTLNMLKSISILVTISLVFNLFLIFGYSGNLDIAVVSNFGLLGSIFINQLTKKNDNLKFIYSGSLSIIYLVGAVIFFDTTLILFIFAFILGVFIQLFLEKQRNIYIVLLNVIVIVVFGFVVLFTGLNTKGLINNYRVNKVEKRLLKQPSDDDVFNLEKELVSNNKSVLTYYELGMIKLMTSSKQDAKKVFLEGLNFDNTFAPMYYNLALIERQEGNYSKSKEYAQRAYELEKVEKYKNLVDELNNN
ncbi:hypothetical protein O3802_01375 [Gemella sp. 27098_8_92]|uniref:tetratricopeptide repeat protein n=1 Tax=Gemella sp. 27098_8_92 TaxID=3003687 RepID=UPI00352DF4B2